VARSISIKPPLSSSNVKARFFGMGDLQVNALSQSLFYPKN
jgi:hypothetical protein